MIHGTRKRAGMTDVQEGRARLALTTYSTMVNEVAQLRDVRWEAVFFDEASVVPQPDPGSARSSFLPHTSLA